MEYQRQQQGVGPVRTVLFGFVCLGIMVGWTFLHKKIWPPQPAPVAVADADGAEQDATGNDATGNDATGQGPEDGPDSKKNVAGVAPLAPQSADVQLPGHPVETIKLGSLDPDSGFRMEVQIETFGAAVRAATLNDKRFVVADLPAGFPDDQPRPQLKLLGNNLQDIPPFIEELPTQRPNLSFDMAVDSVDRAWRKIDPDASLSTLNWRIAGQEKVPGTELVSSITLELKSPDQLLTFRKTFRLNRTQGKDADDQDPQGAVEPTADMLDVILEISNTGPEAANLHYGLYGPVGLPLENEKNARKFRDIQAGLKDGEGGVDTDAYTAADLVSDEQDGDVNSWSVPVKYIGVDVQYFAALMFPEAGQLPSKSIQPVLIGPGLEKDQWHDLSLQLNSDELKIGPGKSVRHRFQVYLGPKTTENLAGLQADGIIDAGWFPMIRHVMVWLLNRFHSLGMPFGLAIILLTVCVRCCMFPISRKMARSQNRMKALQPLIAELKEKYKDEPQKMSQAQMELWRKEGVNPLGGCLPALCQLPIFVALYSALYSWVDLRMASFLWIDNLAAPDHLGDLPFDVPFLGEWFNLLPLVTVGLFYAQQKMTMPVPINDEMAMQQKMMTFMMLFMGFLFYSFPAGLNVYFIASSLWGMCERKILEKLPEKPVDPEKLEARRKKKENGWLARMMKQATEAAELQKQLASERDGSSHPPKNAGPGRKNQGRGGGGKKKRRR
ncbi:MAG: YidC/Oxa1 family insertase periplasmic-domain containing protein [Planctomycetaceae bacterium]